MFAEQNTRRRGQKGFWPRVNDHAVTTISLRLSPTTFATN